MCIHWLTYTGWLNTYWLIEITRCAYTDWLDPSTSLYAQTQMINGSSQSLDFTCKHSLMWLAPDSTCKHSLTKRERHDSLTWKRERHDSLTWKREKHDSLTCFKEKKDMTHWRGRERDMTHWRGRERDMTQWRASQKRKTWLIDAHHRKERRDSLTRGRETHDS